MIDGQAYLSLFVGVLAVVATLAAATAVLFSTRTKTTIDGLRGDVVDYERRISRLEGEGVELRAENGKLQAQNETLRTMKDATAAVDRVAAALHAGHEEILSLIRATSFTHKGGTP